MENSTRSTIYFIPGTSSKHITIGKHLRLPNSPKSCSAARAIIIFIRWIYCEQNKGEQSISGQAYSPATQQRTINWMASVLHIPRQYPFPPARKRHFLSGGQENLFRSLSEKEDPTRVYLIIHSLILQQKSTTFPEPNEQAMHSFPTVCSFESFLDVALRCFAIWVVDANILSDLFGWRNSDFI